MNTKLIKVLRTAAELIESNEVEYEWGDWGTCNIGIVAQVATGLSAEDITKEILAIPTQEGEYYGTYCRKIDYCLNTGLPLNFIIQTLLDLGMTIQDIKDLEYLKGTEEDVELFTKEYLATYLNNWANELENLS